MFKITVRMYIVLYRDGVLVDFYVHCFIIYAYYYVLSLIFNKFFILKNHPNYKSSLEVRGREIYDQRQHLESTVSPGVKLCSCQPPLLSGLVAVMAFQKDLYAFAISMTS